MGEMPPEVQGREPAWLVAAADQRLAYIKEQGAAAFSGLAIVMTPLTTPASESPKDQFEWEHTCDNCKLPFPLTDTHVIGSVMRQIDEDTPVYFIFGACKPCMHLDG